MGCRVGRRFRVRDHFGSFGRLDGSLGSIALILLWFYISALAVLVGAEIDCILTARATGRPEGEFNTALRRRQRASSPAGR